MKHFDFHTHTNKINSCKSITCEDFKKIGKILDGQLFSLQMHPWHLPQNFTSLPSDFREAAKSELIYAIGEIGLDRLKGPSLEVQIKYFDALLDLANELKKPVILHVVRCADEVLRMLKKYPDVNVIWHGFRGKKELFERLVDADIFVSLHHSMLENNDFTDYLKMNSKYQDKIGLESDDTELDTEKLYCILENKINE